MKELKKDSSGTGSFCLIPLSNKGIKLKTLITNNHVLDIDDISPGKQIKILVNQGTFSKTLVIDANRKIYTNPDEKIDITIIEIKDSDNLNYIHYLEIDKRVFNDTKYIEKEFPKMYIIHYPGNSMKVYTSHGEMTIKKDFIDILHKCNTKAWILWLSDFRIIFFQSNGNS